ncbi:MAG: 4Fe-4S binding protein [Deltaproteobacteria bacterium]|nr:4Fe-4S binding protein [Deltaproteobacteria bacterium]
MTTSIIAKRWFQRLCQTGALFFINGYYAFFFTLTVYQGSLRSICLPVLNCHSCPLSFYTCPIGAIQHFLTIGTLPIFVLSIIALVGITCGRMFCGLVCPFGLLQDVLFKLGSIRIEIPPYLRFVKYVILIVLVMLLPYFVGLPTFCKVCPTAILEAGFPHALIDQDVGSKLFNQETGMFIGWMFLIKAVLLAVILLASVNMKRPFCRVLCPLGALLGLFNRFTLLGISVKKESCNKCQLCARLCPVDLSIYSDPDSAECVRCMKCTYCKEVSAKIQPLSLSMRRRDA